MSRFSSSILVRPLRAGFWAAALAAFIIWSPASAQQAPPDAPAIHGNDIGGVVTGANGPEAGVWVIAETDDLPTKFARIVVTDDQGRYVLPDLPSARYRIWVRGYGLIDSIKKESTPGNIVNHDAIPAPNPHAAAEFYPSAYWYAMLRIPKKNEFPLGNAKTQEAWLDVVKTNGCLNCHNLGTKATREIPKAIGVFSSHFDAWSRRLQSGQAGRNMIGRFKRVEPERFVKEFANWTERIEKGELPKVKPTRPTGVERNAVITIWDWSKPTAYMHDEIATDRRNPTVNAYGKIYGAPEHSTDEIPVLDPMTHEATVLIAPYRDKNTRSATRYKIPEPSIYYGNQKIWDAHTSVHNPMFDEKGRVWFIHTIRNPKNPVFCTDGSHPSSKLYPFKRAGRHLSMYEPKTNKWTLIDTCFQTHHLQFDENNVLWTSGGGNPGRVIGWFDRDKFEKTGDAVASQGWARAVVDTNGNGKRDDFVGMKDPVDPAKDKMVRAGAYGLEPNPADDSVWGSVNSFPGYIVRYVPGDNPPETMLAEIYKPPAPGYGPRGMSISSEGVVYVGLSSGHLGAFDRRKCKGPLNGPKAATGELCPEGWTLHPLPGPQFEGLDAKGSVESVYYAWVDQHDTLGFGKDVAIATGNQNESLILLKDGEFVQLRVPYPMGFYIKGLDGRIDDPNAGWKGRGLWTTTGSRTPFHMETGKGTKPKVYKFQLRPDPLAH